MEFATTSQIAFGVLQVTFVTRGCDLEHKDLALWAC